MIAVAIEPKTKADQEKMGNALQRLGEEDPTFRIESDEETGQTLIHGMGELHLEVIVDRMLREFKVDANVGKPQVAYRETIRKRVEKVVARFVRQTGGRGQFGHVVINLEPAPGEGFEFVNKIKGGVIPGEFIGPAEQGMREALENGVKAGYPMVDVKVELVDGSYHDVDSSEMAFKIAGSMAIQEGARKANPVLLEPVMAVEVVTPEDFLGDVIGDLSPPPRQSPGPGAARQRARRPGLRPAGRNVRLRNRPSLLDPGARQLHDAVRALRGGPREHRRGDRRAPLWRASRSELLDPTATAGDIWLYFPGSPAGRTKPCRAAPENSSTRPDRTTTSKGRTERDVKGEVRAR